MSGIHYSQKIKIILQLSDLILLNLAFIVTSFITTSSASFLPKGQTTIFLIIINLFWVISADNSDLYQLSRKIQINKKIYKQAFIITLNFLVVFLILKLSVIFAYNPLHIIIYYVLCYILLITGKVALFNGLRYFQKRGFNSR